MFKAIIILNHTTHILFQKVTNAGNNRLTQKINWGSMFENLTKTLYQHHSLEMLTRDQRMHK